MVIKAYYSRLRARVLQPKRQIVLKKLARELPGTGSIADLGCGSGNTMADALGLRRAHGHLHHIGVDIHEPSLTQASKAGRVPNPVLADLRDLPIPSKSVDTAFLVDVIEHFERSDAARILSEAERIARRTVVVVTPRGFMEQHESDGNPWQEHRSGWEACDLRSMGFTVTGVDVVLDGLRRKLGKAGHVLGAAGELSFGALHIFPARFTTMLFAVKRLER